MHPREEERAAKYKIVIQWDDIKRDYLAMVPELGNCLVRGATRKEALENVEAALRRHIEELSQRHMQIPLPLSEHRFSGKIFVRVDPILHRDVVMKADMHGLTLKQYVEKKLREE